MGCDHCRLVLVGLLATAGTQDLSFSKLAIGIAQKVGKVSGITAVGLDAISIGTGLWDCGHTK
jgi:hypothetical protein